MESSELRWVDLLNREHCDNRFKYYPLSLTADLRKSFFKAKELCWHCEDCPPVSCCSLSATIAAVLPGLPPARCLKLWKAVGCLFGLQQIKDITSFLGVLADSFDLNTPFWFWSRTNHCCFQFIVKNLNAFNLFFLNVQSNPMEFWNYFGGNPVVALLHKVSGKAY